MSAEIKKTRYKFYFNYVLTLFLEKRKLFKLI